MIFSDPYPDSTFQLVSDSDPTFQLVSDSYPDPDLDPVSDPT